MKLLPYEKFDVKVGIPARLVQRRLQDNSSHGSFPGAGDGEDLVGEVAVVDLDREEIRSVRGNGRP